MSYLHIPAELADDASMSPDQGSKGGGNRAGSSAPGSEVWIETPGQLRVRFDRLPPELVAPSVTVSYDSAIFATLPASGTEAGSWELMCSIPPGARTGPLRVLLKNAADGTVIGRHTIDLRVPQTNPHGLPASDVFDITAHAMFSVPWFEFDGSTLTVAGAHLPPLGDPSLLDVAFADGVVGTLEYPLPSPDFGAHYWYWPNAHLSGFRVRINLAASDPKADAFSFRFVTRAATAPSTDAPAARAPRDSRVPQPWADRGRIWIPRDMRDFMGFPTDETQLSRVQTWSNARTVSFTGYNAFKTFESLLARHGVTPRRGLKLLDWGCGHGRVARHFINHWTDAEIHGADIDAENIGWCQTHLPGGTFQVAPLWPPIEAKDGQFDAVIGLSVMTHLTQDAQAAWMTELRRILKPGGVALITFSGHGSAAYASIHQTPEFWARWLESGFDDGQIDTALNGKIADPTYYRITHQSPRHARATWSRVMPIIDIEPQAFGYQDVAILRAR